MIVDSIIYEGAEILNSIVLNSSVGKNTTVGPFAHLREETVIKDSCRIGNFVEVKKSKIGDKSKASHLAYIGDSEIGLNCNFGCGSITVNYDGINKHKTVIGDNVFIGCNTNLVAPVKIYNQSFIACGSTITSDVPENTLAIARSRQLNKIDYYKGKITVSDMREGINCLKRCGECLGKDNLIYRSAIEGINNKMNTDIEMAFTNDHIMEVFVTEAIIQNLQAGAYIDLSDVKNNILEEKYKNIILEFASKFDIK